MTPGVMEYIASCPRVDGDILEVGSYDMNGSPRSLFPHCRSYVGVDLVEGPGVDFVMDCHDLKFPAETFDMAVDAERLEHDTDFFRSCREIRRVLKRGGLYIVTTRAWGGFHPHCLPNDFWRFTDEGLRLLLTRSGFEVLDIRYGEQWHAVRDCSETGGCVEHPEGGKHEDVFDHAVYGFARKP